MSHEFDDITDGELAATIEIVWKSARSAMVRWQQLAKEQARRDALKKREEKNAG